MAKRDYYEVLGINKNATKDEIKKAYRKLAMEHHPDRGGDKTIFQEITEANEILSDDVKRERYDRFGHEGPKSFGGGYNPMEDFFQRTGFNPFERQHTTQRRGSDLQLNIKLTLEEIFTGVDKKYKYKRHTSCNPCNGKGGTGTKICVTCSGSGQIVQILNTPVGQMRTLSTCDACGGQGSTYETICNTCNGNGTVVEEETIDINIPYGVSDNMKMIIEQKGNAIKNGIAGDLIISIMEMPHEKFLRNGNDLKLNIKLTYAQLILGDKVEAPTIEGTKIRLNINEYTKVGEVLRILGKGMKQMGTDFRGDMLLNIELLVPDELNDEQLTLIKKLKKLEEKVATEKTK